MSEIDHHPVWDVEDVIDHVVEFTLLDLIDDLMSWHPNLTRSFIADRIAKTAADLRG